ncbi:hypothetical protein [Sinorhizobium meliloti]|uniref:hypothetical protein n=1 Tax=Rhizobium meliloti TaxID=382 RepID=UPI001F1BC52D|nr:hypothetical protein [Sinorhizobium meliloti]
MANFGNPAFGAAMGNAGGMMVRATAGVGLINALGDGIAAAREARYQARYDDALDIAISHAEQMQAMARWRSKCSLNWKLKTKDCVPPASSAKKSSTF